MKHITTRISAVVLTILAITLLTACTHNDGNIGDYFGTWHIESLQQESSAPANYLGEGFLQFQSTVVCARAIDNNHNERADYGSWTETDNTLTLRFPDPNVYYDHVLATLSGGPDFAADQNTFSFTIRERTSRRLTLQIPDKTGAVWTFTLKKQ